MKVAAVVISAAMVITACETGNDVPRAANHASPSTTERRRPHATASADHFTLVARRGDFKVYAPRRLWGLCPADPLPLTRHELRDAERAVVLAANSGGTADNGFDPRGARARAAFGSDRRVFKGTQKRCGAETVNRTAVVDIRFPEMEPGASLSSSMFYVSKEPRGWVLWDWPS